MGRFFSAASLAPLHTAEASPPRRLQYSSCLQYTASAFPNITDLIKCDDKFLTTNCARPCAVSSENMLPLEVLCAPARSDAITVNMLLPLLPSPVTSEGK